MVKRFFAALSFAPIAVGVMLYPVIVPLKLTSALEFTCCKEVEELILARQQGYSCKIAFVIQMEGIFEVRGNANTHPEFAATLQKAKDAGVEVLFLCCRVMPNEVFVEKVIIG